MQTRLAQLYPEYIITRLPEAVLGPEVSPMVANAPQAGEYFAWHIDADPRYVTPLGLAFCFFSF